MLLLPATVTIVEARDTLRMLAQGVSQEPDAEVTLDASGLGRFDTSALAVLLECSRIAAAGKRKIEIVNPPARMTDLAHLYGVDELLGVQSADFKPAANVGESQPAGIPVVPILR